MVSPAFPGLFFAFAGLVLFLFASISPPAWTETNFLSATTSAGTTVFGVFGECLKGGSCTTKSVGYTLSLSGASDVNINPTVLHNLTYTLILHPIAGGLGLLGFIFGLIGVAAASRAMTVLMALCTALGGFVGIVAFVIDMVLWSLLKNRISDAGYHATLGNANWFTIGGTVALFLSMCTSVCGAFGRFASGRPAGEKY
ncbi:hypothetical protein Q5752_000102 [Cryptotrichosporon argae]